MYAILDSEIERVKSPVLNWLEDYRKGANSKVKMFVGEGIDESKYTQSDEDDTV